MLNLVRPRVTKTSGYAPTKKNRPAKTGRLHFFLLFIEFGLKSLSQVTGWLYWHY